VRNSLVIYSASEASSTGVGGREGIRTRTMANDSEPEGLARGEEADPAYQKLMWRTAGLDFNNFRITKKFTLRKESLLN
jgi:hypothetical protein